MQKVLKPRNITDNEKLALLSIPYDRVDLKLLKELFGNRKDSKAKFLPNDTFTLNKGKFHNKEQCKTTVGRYIFNLFVLSPKLITLIGYQNETMGGDGIGDLEGKLSKLLLDDKITSEDMFEYYDKTQWLGFSLAKFLNASLTYDLLVPSKEITDKKEELIQKYDKAIKSGDVVTFSKMEKELINFAKDNVKEIPDMQIYDSGARGKFGNNYKNTTLLRGGMKNLADPNDTYISTASLVEGIPSEEMGRYADLITQASYSRAVGTREGGYEGKKLAAAFQSMMVDEKGSDCGTTLTKKFKLTKKNKSSFMYRYIVEKGKLVFLDESNIDSYVGKIVDMRTPLYCKNDKYCSKCAGELFNKLGIENVGLLTTRIGTSLLNASLKQFHDMTLKTVEINIEDFIS
jgi:hypothetical protein